MEVLHLTYKLYHLVGAVASDQFLNLWRSVITLEGSNPSALLFLMTHFFFAHPHFLVVAQWILLLFSCLFKRAFLCPHMYQTFLHTWVPTKQPPSLVSQLKGFSTFVVHSSS
jgi:hypothetical protein